MSAFDDVLSIGVDCRVLRIGTAAILVLGDASDAWVAAQAGRDIPPWRTARILFGLPVYTAPWPILVKQVIAERGLTLQSLALFGWIEDNFITEPRAEIHGITPFGEEPLLYMRDFDLDRPPQCCVLNMAGAQPAMLLLAGVLWVDGATDERHILPEDDAAVCGLELALPADARGFAEMLRAECAGGRGLRAALKALRKQVAPELMALADGWRVLTRAVPMACIGQRDVAAADAFDVRQLEAPAPKKIGRRR